jgi:4-oxalocrotonate tautomerase
MPHVIVKLWPGKTEAQKQQLAAEITQSVTSVLGNGPESVSVAFREVPSPSWKAEVYTPDVVETDDALFKTPGYAM